MTDPTRPTAALPPDATPPTFAGPVAAAWALVRTGRIRLAVEELHALQRAESAATLTSPQLALAMLLQVELDLAAGEVAAATGHLGPLTALTGEVEALAAELASGEAAAAYGDHADARDHFLAAGAMPGAEEVLVRPWWVGAVPALVRTGRRREGAELAREHVARAEESRDPFTLAHGLRALATADTCRDPLGMLRRARQLAGVSGSRRLAVQLDSDIAALTILSPGTPGPEIVPMLREAESYAGEEGLWPLHARVVALLARVGEAARPLAGRTLDVLTPAEQRVVRLAASGLTNRQVAAELGVSIKGVEWHLSRVYRKLGIPSREALVTLLGPQLPDAD
ncbi:LuxR C-terminal-related transcriptional regulator [Nocardioides sp. BP30]|uniref:helix-turn-helix transcriptional regulator n=1 Tax=Nocardioides sp. BP30 TaxID=3036374 RepID=UPI0024691D50|nr:LuxR family transcriptional regulator [Nocardioides sp. BP30]WGL52688.1 LuxR C-terminal-related transcriptional regulator [Nocardioides sp. BP30]